MTDTINQTSIRSRLTAGGAGFSRRRALVGAAGLTAAAVAAGCSTGSGGGTGPADSGGGSEAGGDAAGLEMPTRTPFDGVTPDVPGDDELLIPDGFYNYPAEPVPFLSEPLPPVAPISYLVQGNAPGIPVADNGRYDAINAQLNTTVEFIFGGRAGDWTNRWQVMLASNDLPDLCMMQTVPRMPQVLNELFTDLTPYLSGDNIAQFPGLASKPSSAWQVPMLNGKLWGIPMPRPAVANIVTIRTDEFEARGVPDWEISNGEELMDMMVELTDRSQNKFATGADPTVWMLGILAQMHGAPNTWRLEGDTFVHQYATEEYTAAVESLKQLWDAGVFHPNSITEPANNGLWFRGGNTATLVQGFAGWSTMVRDGLAVDVLRPTGWDGGDYQSHLGAPAYGAYVGIPKNDESRVQELLTVLDAMASPFGTEEFLVNFYGLEGDHYTFDDDGNPINNERGLDEYIPGFTYMGVPYSAQLYTPGSPDLTDTQSDYLNWLQPNAVPDPSLGLYSETFSTDGATAGREITDTLLAILQDRQPMSDWAVAVDDFMSEVGTTAADEFAEAYQQANS